MDCARINCAHDDPNVWQAIIEHIKAYDKSCKIMMDLGGPKLRTGQMKPGPKVIHIKPKRNALGQVVSPAKVWLAPYGILPETQEQIDAIIPVNKKWLKKTKQGSYISFNDARDKKCKLFIEAEEGMGRWANCSDSAFITMDTLLYVHLEKKSTSEIHTVQELLPLEEIIYLFEGDYLRIDKAPILGEPAVLDEQGQIIEMAHISCTLPDVFDFVKTGESVFFDDGKIGGIIAEVHDDHLLVKITETKKNGGKLKAEKGINFPDSNIQISGLTQKDKEDLKFVAQHADSVNFSFVTSKSDVAALLEAMASLEASLGIILKIETLEAYKNLPNILLKAMEHYPIGVMIARGDLAIETGWKNFAVIQEELLRMCKAAHIPTVWATQVLENLAKKGVPTRSEITDAALAQRSECVMLNKGYFITKAVKMLEKVLREIQHIQHKEKKLYPKLKFHPIS
jgi:pyruvate kinase